MLSLRCLLSIFATFGVAVFAALPEHSPSQFSNPLQDKNFFLLSSLIANGQLRTAVDADTSLRQVKEEHRKAMGSAVDRCRLEVACETRSFLWSDRQIDLVSARLRDLYARNADMRTWVDKTLPRSGMFSLYRREPGAELLVNAWRDAALDMNRVINVYANGQAPRYPEIDSISYDVKSDSFRHAVANLLGSIARTSDQREEFFSTSLAFAVGLLRLNGRDEAARFEPLQNGENRQAIEHVRSVDWSRFPYAVVLVPGAGSGRGDEPLSLAGKVRLRLAASRFAEKKAPFLFVSGGFVHPAHTKHCEAYEMKQWLMKERGIPEEAILIDPHARHTTTNIRNAVREIYRYGIPFDKPALVTTDPLQSFYISSDKFHRRCLDELHYFPCKLLTRVSVFDQEFTGSIDSLQADAADPLDP